MSHIIIDKAQAEAIRGNYGIYSAIEPIPAPDGKFIVPEACLSDADLAEIKTTLESYVTPTNVQEINDLPNVGQQCVKDVIYKYSDGTLGGYNGLVKCVQTHNRTIYPPIETPALFSFFRENSDTLEWIVNEYVYLGWKRIYQGTQYEVIQEHMTLATYTPPATLGVLWKSLAPATGEWAVGVAYKVGDEVMYQTKKYRCRQAHTSISTWTPPATPALWLLI